MCSHRPNGVYGAIGAYGSGLERLACFLSGGPDVALRAGSGDRRLSGIFSIFLRTVRDAVDYEVVRRSVLRDIGPGIAQE